MAKANRTISLCSVEGCSRKRNARGMCTTHYNRWRKSGTTERLCRACSVQIGPRRGGSWYCSEACRDSAAQKPCKVSGCEKIATRAGLCDMHYERKRVAAKTAKCDSPMCEKRAITRGFCYGHYARLRAGKPTDTPLFSRRATGTAVLRNPEGLRQCGTCNKYKDDSEFTAGSSSDGLSVNCTSCRANYRLRKYNVTEAEYNAMLEKQGGVCAICGRTSGARRFHIDHDHSCCPGGGSCGECVRGLLCGNCNSGLGQFKDDPEVLHSAIEYIKRYRKA